MSEFQPFPGAALDRCGLNRHAVFDLADLPDDVVNGIAGGTTGYRQLILIGHGGRALWESVTKSGSAGADPIDDFTVRTIRQWMSEFLPDNRYAILYPGSDTIDLQRLGALAGWHHASPFMVGIDAEWGTWYAYRAVVLADTHFAPSQAVEPWGQQLFPWSDQSLCRLPDQAVHRRLPCFSHGRRHIFPAKVRRLAQAGRLAMRLHLPGAGRLSGRQRSPLLH